MTQIALPEEDAYADATWSGGGDLIGEPPTYPDVSYPDLYTMIRDQSDDFWMHTEHLPSNVIYVCKLSQIVNPEDLAGDWTVRVRAKKASTSITPLDLTVELYQNYGTGAGPPPTGLIASETFYDIPSTLTDLELVVPEENREFVLDPMLLYVRIIADT